MFFLLLFLTHIACANEDKMGILGVEDPCLGGAGWLIAGLPLRSRGPKGRESNSMGDSLGPHPPCAHLINMVSV